MNEKGGEKNRNPIIKLSSRGNCSRPVPSAFGGCIIFWELFEGILEPTYKVIRTYG